MKKRTKNILVNILIIVLVLIIALLILKKPASETEEGIAKCISGNSILYIQEGCSHCEIQKNLFGNYSDYLTIVDCTKNPEKCLEISATPTWIINQKQYRGVQSIQKLKELTSC